MPVRSLYITEELKHKNKIMLAVAATKLSSQVLLQEPWHLRVIGEHLVSLAVGGSGCLTSLFVAS